MKAWIVAIAVIAGTAIGWDALHSSHDAQAQSGPTVSLDRTEYWGNEFATVTLTGAECAAGQTVYLQYHPVPNYSIGTTPAVVGPDGRAEATIHWTNEGGTFRATAFDLAGCDLPNDQIFGNEDVVVKPFMPEVSATGLFLDFESTRFVAMSGLPMCAGEAVQLGVTTAPLASTVVDAEGVARAEVPLRQGRWYVVVEGECVPGGRWEHNNVLGSTIENVQPVSLEVYAARGHFAPFEPAVELPIGAIFYGRVSGLGPCANKTVQVGLYTASLSRLSWVDSALNELAQSFSTLVVPASAGPLQLGVTGDCTGGKVYYSGNVLMVQASPNVPRPPAPGPPNTGAGTDGSGAGSGWPLALSGLALVALAAGAARLFR